LHRPEASAVSIVAVFVAIADEIGQARGAGISDGAAVRRLRPAIDAAITWTTA
jgi:hypothetical protein